MQKFILIGHSHTYALKAGLEQLGIDDAACVYCFLPKIEQHIMTADPKADLIPAMREAVRDFCLKAMKRPLDDDLAALIAINDIPVLLSLGGNEHNVLGMIHTGDQFDFVLPDRPDLVIKNAKIFPLDAAYRQVARSLVYVQQLALVFTELLGKGLIVQAPPAPIGDNGYIFNNLDAYFKDKSCGKASVSENVFRYKLYALRETIMREYYSSIGIAYNEGPAEMTISDMYLDPRAYAGDATHASHLYGIAALRNLYPSRFRSSVDDAHQSL